MDLNFKILKNQTHNTLLCGKLVAFKPIDGSDELPLEWTRVTVEDSSKIITMKKVGVAVYFFY